MVTLGAVLTCIAHARLESIGTGRQLWIETRNGLVQSHLAHRKGWHLIARVIGEEVL